VITVLALDLSVKSTGFACWSEGQLPAHGTWALGDQAHMGRAFVRLHRHLLDLHTLDPIECLTFEEAIPGYQLHGSSSAQTIFGAAGLAAHAMSFSEAVGCRWREVNITVWRKHFIGSMKRGTKTPNLKHMAMQRCRELGFDPAKHDAAEACGLLDYQLSIDGIIAPWRNQHILEREMRPSTERSAA
jgi:hypothetical protein